MIEHGRGPGIGGVAVIAGGAAGDMVGCFTDGRRAVVAAEAGAEHGAMIDPGHRGPGVCTMTVLADGGGLDMGGVLAGGSRAVVTAAAVTGDGAVIEHGRGPGIGGVAVIAGGAAGDMVGCFTDGSRAVVAAEAGAKYSSMVDLQYRCPVRGAVTVLACRGGLNVGSMLAGGGGAIVTAAAITGHGVVIECCRGPGIGGVAVITGGAAGDVI